jgi:hypothetical protein
MGCDAQRRIGMLLTYLAPDVLIAVALIECLPRFRLDAALACSEWRVA